MAEASRWPSRGAGADLAVGPPLGTAGAEQGTTRADGGVSSEASDMAPGTTGTAPIGFCLNVSTLAAGSAAGCNAAVVQASRPEKISVDAVPAASAFLPAALGAARCSAALPARCGPNSLPWLRRGLSAKGACTLSLLATTALSTTSSGLVLPCTGSRAVLAPEGDASSWLLRFLPLCGFFSARLSLWWFPKCSTKTLKSIRRFRSLTLCHEWDALRNFLASS